MADDTHVRRYAENNHIATKNDGENSEEQSLSLIKARKLSLYKDSSKFRQLLDSVFKEEGGYEDRKIELTNRQIWELGKIL